MSIPVIKSPKTSTDEWLLFLITNLLHGDTMNYLAPSLFESSTSLLSQALCLDNVASVASLTASTETLVSVEADMASFMGAFPDPALDELDEEEE